MTDTRDPSASDGRWAQAASTAGPATPAATVMVLRDASDGPEVLMLRRSRGGAFSGMWVFPGGRVEPSDLSAAGSESGADRSAPAFSEVSEIAVACRAAVREAEEEAGIHLHAADLVVHSHWEPPLEASRRFSTWFFLVGVDATTEVTVDLTEVHEHRWVTPAVAMVERDAGALPLATPTWMTLWQLASYPDVASAVAAAKATGPARFATRVVRGDGVLTFVWPGDAAYEDGDIDRLGGRRRLTAPDDGPWQAHMAEAAPSDAVPSDAVPSDAVPSDAVPSDAATRGV